MSLMTAIEVAASGLTAQRQRLEVHISNLANATVVQPAGSEPFRPKDVLFSSVNPEQSFGVALDDAVQGVEVSGVVTLNKDPVPHYEPNHPYADDKGYVYYPNVNSMDEMGNITFAARSYEANLQAINMVKEMEQKTLEILR